MRTVNLADGTAISEYSKPYIIAEVNSSHNGSIEIAKQMVDAAVQAGCDCVKFQSWSAQSLYSKTYYKKNPIAKRFVDKLSLSPEALKEMAEYCHEKQIGFSSTPYSRAEVDFLAEECNVPFIKISSMEVSNPEYVRYIAEKQIPIVISTGMAEYAEVQRAVQMIESTGNRNIVILHCVSLYPTPPEKVNLNNILGLRQLFPEYPIGFSDHTLGDAAAVAATTMGAAVLEKHVTLDAGKIGMDNQMAMEPGALGALVDKCKSIADMMGSTERVLAPEELRQRENMRRSVIIVRDMMAGEKITAEDLDVKRPGTGIPPERIPEIIGCTLKENVEADSVLMESDVDAKNLKN